MMDLNVLMTPNRIFLARDYITVEIFPLINDPVAVPPPPRTVGLWITFAVASSFCQLVGKLNGSRQLDKYNSAISATAHR